MTCSVAAFRQNAGFLSVHPHSGEVRLQDFTNPKGERSTSREIPILCSVERSPSLAHFDVALFVSHEVAAEFSRGRKPTEKPTTETKAPKGRHQIPA
jgi:hypothetical protein